MIRLGCFLAFAFCPMVGAAGYYADTYCTTISQNDRHNSKGVRLTSVAQIIQNERANFHLNRHRDTGDEGDDSFARREDRAQIPGMFRANSVGPFLDHEITSWNEDIHICVRIEGSDMPSDDLIIEIWRNGRG